MAQPPGGSPPGRFWPGWHIWWGWRNHNKQASAGRQLIHCGHLQLLNFDSDIRRPGLFCGNVFGQQQIEVSCSDARPKEVRLRVCGLLCVYSWPDCVFFFFSCGNCLWWFAGWDCKAGKHKALFKKLVVPINYMYLFTLTVTTVWFISVFRMFFEYWYRFPIWNPYISI